MHVPSSRLTGLLLPLKCNRTIAPTKRLYLSTPPCLRGRRRICLRKSHQVGAHSIYPLHRFQSIYACAGLAGRPQAKVHLLWFVLGSNGRVLQAFNRGCTQLQRIITTCHVGAGNAECTAWAANWGKDTQAVTTQMNIQRSNSIAVSFAKAVQQAWKLEFKICGPLGIASLDKALMDGSFS